MGRIGHNGLTAAEPPVAKAALLGRCPRCGKGALFRGLLDVRDTCESCGLDLRSHDAGDGPAVAGIFVLGAITVGHPAADTGSPGSPARRARRTDVVHRGRWEA